MTPFTAPTLPVIALTVAIAPAYSALVGIADLSTPNQRIGFETKTRADLSATEVALNQAIFALLGATLLPADPDATFEEYLTAFEATPAETLRARIDAPPGIERPLAPSDAADDDAENAAIRRAAVLLADPPLLKETLSNHLRSMWEQHLADEWRKKLPLIVSIVRTLDERGLPQGDALTILRALLGRDLPPPIAADLASIRSIVLVPSPFVALTAIRPNIETELWLFVASSTLTSWALRQAPLSAGELLARVSPLADKTRLRIVELLAQHGELSAQQLIAALDLSQSVISRHLASLGGYVNERRGEGANKLYRIDRAHVEWTLVMLRQFAAPPERQLTAASLTPIAHPVELRRFMNRDGQLTQFPTRERDRHLVLRHIAARLTANQIYTEREINERIQSAIAFDDFVTIRRSLFNAGYIGREKDGSRYWLVEPAPPVDQSTI